MQQSRQQSIVLSIKSSISKRCVVCECIRASRSGLSRLLLLLCASARAKLSVEETLERKETLTFRRQLVSFFLPFFPVNRLLNPLPPYSKRSAGQKNTSLMTCGDDSQGGTRNKTNLGPSFRPFHSTTHDAYIIDNIKRDNRNVQISHFSIASTHLDWFSPFAVASSLAP